MVVYSDILNCQIFQIFFLGPRQGMTPVTAFGSTGSGLAYTQRELNGVGNRDGQNLAPNLGPGTKGLA